MESEELDVYGFMEEVDAHEKSEELDLHNVTAKELAGLCFHRHKATDFQLERVFYTATNGKSQPRFRVGVLSTDSAVTAWISIGVRRRKSDWSGWSLGIDFWRRAPGSGCDARDGRELCDWKRCSADKIDIRYKGLDLNWTQERWDNLISYKGIYAITPWQAYCEYLLNLCKKNMDDDLWADIISALSHREARCCTSGRALDAEFQRHYPQLTSDRDIWNAYNHDNASIDMQLDEHVALRIKKAYERIFRTCAPPVVLLKRMMALKRKNGQPTCDRTSIFVKWRRREDRRIRDG